MPRSALVGLQYRRRHVLAVGGDQWTIDAGCSLRGRTTPLPDTLLQFELELSSLDPMWQSAIARARTLEGATIDGIPARLRLRTVELQFATFADQTEPYGSAAFVGMLEEAIPFPRSLHDMEFANALAQASKAAGRLAIQADEIESTERYWIFPIQNIGLNGAIVDRTNGQPFVIDGSLDRSTWIWAYEHRLLDEPAGDLVIERVVDGERAFAALRQFARLRRGELETLPLVLEGCATWLAASSLKQAESALTWRVAVSQDAGDDRHRRKRRRFAER